MLEYTSVVILDKYRQPMKVYSSIPSAQTDDDWEWEEEELTQRDRVECIPKPTYQEEIADSPASREAFECMRKVLSETKKGQDPNPYSEWESARPPVSSCALSSGAEGIDQNCASVLAGVAFIESAIACILNTEGEKVRRAVELASTPGELVLVNDSLNETISHVSKLEDYLCEKLKVLYNLMKVSIPEQNC